MYKSKCLKKDDAMNNPWENWNGDKKAEQEARQQMKHMKQMNNAFSNAGAWPEEKALAGSFTPLTPVTPDNPMAKYDAMGQDQLLMEWDNIKKKLSDIKTDEIALRKYIVSRAFPNAQEGTNTQELGNGYELKAVVHYNYKLMENNKVEEALDKIALVGNEGSFIASRLVSWTPNFLLTEYRILQEQAEAGNQTSIEIKKLIDSVLVIDDAAPKLEIKEPKAKKK